MNTFQRVLCVECKINFGSEQRHGMCSVCFKTREIIIVDDTSTFDSKDLKTEIMVPETLEEKAEKINITELEDSTITNKLTQKSKFHCFSCETKVGYLGFLCKCEYIFCGKHRHFSEHNCTFDFKTYDRQKLNSKK